MRRSLVVLFVILLVGVPSFLILVPIISVTENPPCPPEHGTCMPLTYTESISFYYFQVGAVYALCTGSDYHLADARGGYGCAGGQFFTR